MLSRSVAAFAAVLSAVSTPLVFTPCLALPTAAALQETRGAGADAIPALPPDIQANLNKLLRGLKAAQHRGNTKAEAAQFNGIGDLYFGVSAYKQASDAYNQASTTAHIAKDAQQEAAALTGLGNCYRVHAQGEKALSSYQQALDLATTSGDLRGQAAAMNGIASVDDNLGKNQDGLDLHNRALALAQKAADVDLEAAILNGAGNASDNLGESQKALDLYTQSLSSWRAAGDRPGEGKALNNIGIHYAEIGETEKALDYSLQALAVRRATGDRAGVAGTLTNIAILYKTLGQKQKALDSFKQLLPVQRELGNRAAEATTLNEIGDVYAEFGRNDDALESYEAALAVEREVGDRAGEAGTLNNIGGVYSQLGEKQKALEYLGNALALWRATGGRRGEAATLNATGTVYDDLGNQKEALQDYLQALEIWTAANDRVGESQAMNNIAGLYAATGEKQKALEYFNRVLALQSAAGDRGGQAKTLNNMALVYSDLGQNQKALEYLNQALPIRRELGDRAGQASTLNNIGGIYDDLGEKQKALENYTEALALANAVGDPIEEAQIYLHMMLNQKVLQPALAIFYGKQAVNFVQQVRGNIRQLDKALQKSFLASNGDYYHDLADLLIAQGRLPEAQQVLDLLKEQEYADYVRGDTANALGKLALTPAEKQAQEDYERSTAETVKLGQQWLQLNQMSTRTTEQEKDYQQLSAQLDAAGKGLENYYKRLYVLFGESSEANKQVADVKGDVSALSDAIAEMPRTVALYTLVGKQRTSILVITGATTVSREVDITNDDMNRKVAAFQQALRNRNVDPRPAAEEMYKILIAPIKADLDQAQAQTLVWSLDGALRYVPIAALYDGKQYVAENYSTVTITPASIAHLSESPDLSRMSATAMGISQKYETELPALPAVVGELDEIVKDSQVQGANGVLPGTILLDGQFTEEAMEHQLSGPHTVVHIASHFVFEPGDDSQSYLLLAGKSEGDGGFHLTVADFNSNPKLAMRHTDLLTLSACETGMSGNASNGREVDGLGTTAQLKGARAVISSLWDVNDASTGILMADFYKRWAAGAGKVTKVEALRQAQLDLLQGRVSPQSGSNGRGVSAVESEPVKPTGPAGYAHPYYWAPFVLMGNWK